MADRRLLPIGALIVSLIVFGGALAFALQPAPSAPSARPTAIQAVATTFPGTSVAVAAQSTATSPPIVEVAEVAETPTVAATATATAPPSPTRAQGVATRTAPVVAPTPTTAPPVAVAPTITVAPPVAAPPTVAVAPTAPIAPPPTAGVSAGALPPAITPAAAPPPRNPAVIPPTATPPPAPVPTKAPPANIPPVTSGAAPRTVGLPIRVIIPSIGVDASVEQVGVTADGVMDTPANPWNTAWYALGVRPGQPGNAAIAGHVDYHGIGPVVFWDLNKLSVGAEILVVTDSGQTLRFKVRGSEHYTDGNAPLIDIFGPANTVNLNLITCGGTFDPSTRHYDQRLVVYTSYAGQ
jgi:hypothetical protein